MYAKKNFILMSKWCVVENFMNNIEDDLIRVWGRLLIKSHVQWTIATFGDQQWPLLQQIYDD